MRYLAVSSFLVAALLGAIPACSDEASSTPGSSNGGGGAGDGGNGAGGAAGGPGGAGSGGAASGTPSIYRAAVMADGPVAYWRFGERDGATAKDEVGNAHPGTYFGTTTLGVPGIEAADTAVKLDGTSGCIGVGEFFRFAGQVPFSVEGWVNISTYGAMGTRVVSTEGYPTGIRSGWNLSASYGDTGYPYFDAWNSEGTDNLYTMGAYSSVSKDKGKLPLNEWVYLVGTYTDTSEEVWVNGVLRDKENQSNYPLPNEGTMSLGCASNGSGSIYLGLTGSLDEVAIYDKALTPAQIASHFAARAK
jgi:Concanavalin A-like lectin/glucanases superfamily